MALTRSAEDGGGLALMEIEHAHQHSEAAELNDDFSMLGKFGDAGLPLCKGLGSLALVRSDPGRSPTWFGLIVVFGKALAKSAG